MAFKLWKKKIYIINLVLDESFIYYSIKNLIKKLEMESTLKECINPMSYYAD